MQNQPNIDKALRNLLAPAHECRCERPVPVERAARRGAARTHCARCGLPVPIRMSQWAR